ncbi:hypothetical protein [Corynebacterium glyciniphilum]|uniref:hypothetical protein n=1 Tax=Corynebacterium glyciniphilum TaxID=1404244 RepID=UPI00264DCAE2|nr:hypothetical protein [Corynebacterium glyciniphilum]MDN6706402.1 hypothetical protein [Corynebacterium glyciniphilum]
MSNQSKPWDAPVDYSSRPRVIRELREAAGYGCDVTMSPARLNQLADLAEGAVGEARSELLSENFVLSRRVQNQRSELARLNKDMEAKHRGYEAKVHELSEARDAWERMYWQKVFRTAPAITPAGNLTQTQLPTFKGLPDGIVPPGWKTPEVPYREKVKQALDAMNVPEPDAPEPADEPPATLANALRNLPKAYATSSYLDEQLNALADRADELEERTRQAESYAGKYHEAIQQRDEARAKLAEAEADYTNLHSKKQQLEEDRDSWKKRWWNTRMELDLERGIPRPVDGDAA